jgi:hypothetical protein
MAKEYFGRCCWLINRVRRRVVVEEVPTSAGEAGMTISLESSDEKWLERLRGMADEELIRFGKAARSYPAIRGLARRSNDR